MGMMAMGVASLIGTIASVAMMSGGSSAPAAPPPPAPAPEPPSTDDLDIQLAKQEEERRRLASESPSSKDNTKNSLSKTDTLGKDSNIVTPNTSSSKTNTNVTNNMVV